MSDENLQQLISVIFNADENKIMSFNNFQILYDLKNKDLIYSIKGYLDNLNYKLNTLIEELEIEEDGDCEDCENCINQERCDEIDEEFNEDEELKKIQEEINKLTNDNGGL